MVGGGDYDPDGHRLQPECGRPAQRNNDYSDNAIQRAWDGADGNSALSEYWGHRSEPQRHAGAAEWRYGLHAEERRHERQAGHGRICRQYAGRARGDWSDGGGNVGLDQGVQYQLNADNGPLFHFRQRLFL